MLQHLDSARHDSNACILKSRADSLQTQLDEAQGDQRAVWKVSQKLLHQKSATYRNDEDCVTLTSTFSKFFEDKLEHIRFTIASALQSNIHRVFAVKQNPGAAFTGFRAVSMEEVRRVLTTVPSKSSPLDVVPASLTKSCVDVFSPVIACNVIARLANSSFKEGHFPPRYKTTQVLPLLKKHGADPSSKTAGRYQT